jgi:hypothetical protein
MEAQAVLRLLDVDPASGLSSDEGRLAVAELL